MAQLVATCVWEMSAELVVALDNRFGPPVDAYVNGSQVWLRDDGPRSQTAGTADSAITVEWRLHPVPGYERPSTVDTHELFELTAAALATGTEPPAPPQRLWEGLEAYAAYGDDIEPATLAGACAAALGIPPDASGLVDHGRIGDEWERSGGNASILSGLLAELRSSQPPG
jgi:hypothetical protein